MNDDDLDLELDDESAKPVQPRVVKAEVECAPAKSAPQAAKPASATVAGERRGLLSGLSDSVAAVKSFVWTWRTFAIGLVVLLVILVLAENWAPVRFYFLGLAFELPKTVAFVIDVAIGAVLMWLILRRPGKGEEAPE